MENRSFISDQTAKKRRGQRRGNRAWIWIVIVVVFMAAGAVIALDVLGVFDKDVRPGNAGVWAVYDYFNEKLEERQSRVDGVQKEFFDRMLSEPFEVESQIKISSDSLSEFGFPLRSIQADIDAKYDLSDLGIKLSTLGMDLGSAYLIEDEIVLSVMGKASSIPIGLPIEADLSQSMGLGDRSKAFLPFLPADDTLYARLFMQFALAVPDKYTHTQIVDVYSPADNGQVEMNAVMTTLDTDAIKEAAANFTDDLKEDEQLKRELQEVLDNITAYFDIDDMDIDNILRNLENGAIPISSLSWSVFEANGDLVGMSVDATINGEQFNALLVTEFRGKDDYIHATVFQGGEQMLGIQSKTTYDGEKTVIDTEIKAPLEFFTDKSGSIAAQLEGDWQLCKDASDEYTIIVNMVADVMVLDSQTEDKQIPLDISVEADCVLGNDLKSLENSNEWSDINNQEYDNIESLFKMINMLITFL